MASTEGKFKDAVVLVTGGASGLGLACVDRFSKHGMRVVVADLAGPSQSNLAPFGDKVDFIPTDVSSDADVTRLMEHIKQKYGKLDVCINSAGISRREPTYNFETGVPHDLAQFTKVLMVNTVGMFNIIRLGAGLMGKNAPDQDGQRGVIINIASTMGIEGAPNYAAYCASKGGVIAMTLPLAREFGPVGIRVVTLCPGLMATPMTGGAFKDALESKFAGLCAFPKRAGRPEELAQLVHSIVENTMINGEVIRIDGGSRNV